MVMNKGNRRWCFVR